MPEGKLVQESPGSWLTPGRQWVRVIDTAISLNTAAGGGAGIPLGCRAVLVQADPANTAVVAVGGPGITTAPAVGAQLLPGQSRVIAIDDVSKVFVVGGAVGLAIAWEAIG